MKKKIVRRTLMVLAVMCLLTACVNQPAGGASSYRLPDDDFAVAMNPKRDYLVVVNDDHPYDFDGMYNRLLQDDLVYAADVYGEATPLEAATYLAFSQLQVAMKAKGLEIGLYSGYRTKEDQQWVFEYYGELDGWSETNRVQEPGYSEHHTGLLVNMVIFYPGLDRGSDWLTETAERQASMPELKILHETLADYGFIDRYPAGKEDITGVPNEPYEIRFVGSTKIAHEIMDGGLCLEEYLAGPTGK